MRRAIYTLGVRLYGLAIRLASPFHSKAKLWIKGRKNWKSQLEEKIKPGQSWVWFHAASLGEFEQGRNLIEMVRQQFPQHKILLTFFSPSGYEVRKNYAGADFVSYLPIDTPSNVSAFLNILKPRAVFFIKYEIWVNFILEMKARKIPVFLFSSIVRSDSRFFKGYLAPLFCETFRSFSYIFTQNIQSKVLLEAFTRSENIMVAGDTRFDRVLTVRDQFESIAGLDDFVQNEFCVVCGSTWPEDEKIILPIIEKFKSSPIRWIIAPHEIHHDLIAKTIARNPDEMIAFSELNRMKHTHRVLWIDNIGMLSRLYQYGDLAFVGGGFGKGVHNTLEAVVYGIPVAFGPKYNHSDETVRMVHEGTATSISMMSDFETWLLSLSQNEEMREKIGEANRKYVEENGGATRLILESVQEALS